MTTEEFERVNPGASRLGEEISVRLPDGTISRADAIYELDDQLIYFESKNGASARLTVNQSECFRSMDSGVFPRAFGGNARGAAEGSIDGREITSYVIMQVP